MTLTLPNPSFVTTCPKSLLDRRLESPFVILGLVGAYTSQMIVFSILGVIKRDPGPTLSNFSEGSLGMVPSAIFGPTERLLLLNASRL